MHIESFREYCITKKGVTEEFPFNETALVFKVMGKMFALTDIELFTSINLKCDPERSQELRDQYSAIHPGFHMNKMHWNTIHIDGSLSDVFLKDLIDHSYELVVKKLPKAKKEELDAL